MTAALTRMPVAYIPHGGGPWPILDLSFADRAEGAALREYLSSVRTLAPTPPRAVVMISAHWEEAQPTVMSAANPPLLFDYYGFPDEAYKLTWPAPGHPAVASRVGELLRGAGIAFRNEEERGFDHGTFVPMKLIWPDADMPTVQLSLKTGLDVAEHLAIGRALAPLRDEGVLILGSGNSFHNMGAFRSPGPRVKAMSIEFDEWLSETVAADPASRDQRLARWADAPGGRFSHPREEHLLPLMVVAGAAGADRGRTAFRGSAFGARVSAHHFG